MYDKEQISEIFDLLVDKIKQELDDQFTRGRIKGTDYANVYSQLIGEALQLANQAPINELQVENLKKDLEVKNKQIETMNVDNSVKQAQSDKDLLVKDKQIETMDIDNNIKQLQSDKDLLVKDSNIAVNEANRDRLIYETNNILPAQKDEINTHTLLLGSQKIKTDEDVNLTKKQEDHIDQQITSMKQDDEIKYSLAAHDIEIKTQQTDNLRKDIDVKDSQIKFTDRQTKGFDDNVKLKLFSAQLGSWATMFSTGSLPDKPSIIDDDAVSDLYNSLKNSLSM